MPAGLHFFANSFLAGALALALGTVDPWRTACAETLQLARPGDGVVGAVFFVNSRWDDTLLDIGRQSQLGYEDMRRANPEVDVWVPGKGNDVLVPAMFVLPDAPRNGLVLNRPEMRLYYFRADKPGEVQSYPISIGREGWNTPLGSFTVTKKVKGPSWTPPASIRAEHAAQGDMLPKVVPPGPDNPLGPYALRLSVEGYLIHGTNKPWGLGMQVSHGCIRMNNEGIEELFPQVSEGDPVTILDQPYKLGWLGDDLYLEVNIDSPEKRLSGHAIIPESVASTAGLTIDWDAVERAVKENRGVPQLIGTKRLAANPLHLDAVF